MIKPSYIVNAYSVGFFIGSLIDDFVLSIFVNIVAVLIIGWISQEVVV